MATIVRSAAEEKIRAISSWTGGDDGNNDDLTTDAWKFAENDDSGAGLLFADPSVDGHGAALLMVGTLDQVKKAVANLAARFHDTWDACCEDGRYIYSTPGGTEVTVNDDPKIAQRTADDFRRYFRYFKFGGPAPKPFSAPTSPVQAAKARRSTAATQETPMTTSVKKIAATLNRAGLRAQAQRLVRAAGDGAGDGQLPLPEIGIRDDKIEEAVKAIDTEVQQQLEYETEGEGGDGYDVLIKESIQRMSLAKIISVAKEDRHADPAKLQQFVGAIEAAQAAGIDEQTIKDELIWQCSCVAGSIHGPMNKPYAGAAYEKQPVLDAYPVQEIEVQLSDETVGLLAALTEDERQQVGRKVDGYWDADKPDNNLAYIGTDAVWFCCVTGLEAFVEDLEQKIADQAE